MEKLNCWRLPVHPGDEMYTVFDEESDFQIKNARFSQPGANIWKHLISKNLFFDILVFNTPCRFYGLVLVLVWSWSSGPGPGTGPGRLQARTKTRTIKLIETDMKYLSLSLFLFLHI